jgi:glyoxylase-like metal-dependent hydrolase (beta-lactamase superfamily II)
VPSLNPELTEVASGVFVVQGTHVSWVLVVEGSGVTLIDAGYHGDAALVRESLERVGGRLEAVLITHAHADHLGAAGRLHQELGVPVYAHADEAPGVRGDRIEQITPGQIAKRVWRPRVARWTFDILRAGGPRADRIADLTTFTGSAPLDVPGAVVPIPTPGHTSGHTVYHLPERGVLVMGDALSTGHPMTGLSGPHLMDPAFDHDRPRAEQSLRALTPVAADVVVPSHGPVYRGTPARAIATAFARATNSAPRRRGRPGPGGCGVLCRGVPRQGS